jgi:hypothetical protein
MGQRREQTGAVGLVDERQDATAKANPVAADLMEL